MRLERGYSPLGTARQRFARSAGKKRRGARAVASWAIPDDVGAAAAGYDLGTESLYLAWELASYADGVDDAERRGLFFLVLAMLAAQRDGSTRWPVADMDELVRALGATPDDRAAVAALLDQPARSGGLIGGCDDYRPLILDGGHLYTQRLRTLEVRLADALGPRLKAERTAKEPLIDEAVAAVVSDPVTLSGEQELAIRTAVARAVTLITGGPGTGKTSIVVAMLRAFVRLGVPADSIALAAPTGKAAKRLEQSIRRGLSAIGERDEPDEQLLAACPEPQTLHRLLGYSPGTDRFRHHANNPLAQQVVIVDEGSMVDLSLMERLARAVRPDGKLILLGDADQLPSVDVGAVFRDLVAAGAAVRLTRSYRMDAGDPDGRKVLRAAAAVNEGKVDGVELVEARRRDAFLDRWFDERVRFDRFAALARKAYRFGRDGFGDADRADVQALFDHMARSRILAITRETRGTGADAINARFHRRILDELGGNIHGATAFFPGEPILMLRNDYDRRLFNGDQGIVLRVAEGEGRHHFMAVFPRKDDELAVFHIDALRAHIQLAFAMTVHKAQGSEFDHVALVLPERDMPLASRELVYTALTRSRKSAAVVGGADVLRAAVARRIRRHSGLRDRVSRA